MQLKLSKTNYTQQEKEDMSNFFQCALMKGTKKLFENLGYKDMKYIETLYDCHGKIVAHVFEKNGLYGAYGKNAELYADFKYSFFGAVPTPQNNSSYMAEILYFKTKNNEYDIFHGDVCLSENAKSRPEIHEDACTYENRYAVYNGATKTLVYDMAKKYLLNFNDFVEVHSITSQHEEIVFTHKYNGHRYFYVSDFSNMTNPSKWKPFTLNGYAIEFTKVKNIYKLIDTDDNEGLVTYNGHEFEKIVNCNYVTIYDILEDRFVVNEWRKFVIKKFQRQSSLIPPYKIEDVCTIENAEFLELHGEEGIITLNSGKKILLSHYMQNSTDYEQYECDDIFYEGNGIYKCFQYKRASEEVTYICCGQAVNFENSSDEKYHVVELHDRDFDALRCFDSYGQDFKEYYDATSLTLKEKGYKFVSEEYLGSFDIVNICSDRGHYVWNLVTGRTYGTAMSSCMIWHNLFEVNDVIYDVKRYNSYYTNVRVVVAFNKFIVLSYMNNFYICNKDLDYTKITSPQYFINELYQYCIVSNNDKAYYISNNEIIKYDFLKEVNGCPVYESQTSDNFILGVVPVTKKEIKREIALGTLDKIYNCLL